MPSAPLLEVDGVSLRFGGIEALKAMSFVVPAGSIVGLIGPNGAGKTSLFNCLSRIYVPSAGDIRLEGQSIMRLPRHRMPAVGVARTFQNVALFDRLTVRDNVMVGAHSVSHGGFVASMLGLPKVAANEAAIAAQADEAMQFMNIADFAGERAGNLPFPIRKRVEFARALVARPRLLLLDEPAAGLNRAEVGVLREQITRVRDKYGSAVLLVEHHMSLVMSVSDHVVAMDFGQKIAEGTPSEVQASEAVIRSYLGAPAQ